MDKSQRKYAVERVCQITSAKLNAIESKYTTPAVSLKDAEKRDLIRTGKVKMYPENGQYRGGYLLDNFDFSKYEKPAKSDKGAIDKASAEVSKKSREIKDKIMLGDAKEALELLAEFES